MLRSYSEIQEFERLGQLFFGKLLGVPKTTPSEAYYLEIVSVIIKGRCGNYLHSILCRVKNSMLAHASCEVQRIQNMQKFLH